MKQGNDTVRDRFWIWGHEAGCLHKHANNVWKIPGESKMTPAEGASYLGIPNVKAHERASARSVPPLVCAQHGRVVNGVQVSCERT